MGTDRATASIQHISSKKSVAVYFRELTIHGGFLKFLIWKELKVRYRNPVLGILWTTLQPLIYVVALLFVNRFADLSSQAEIPFPVLIFSGVIFWQLFSAVVNGTNQMMASNASILQKVYFPKFLIPLASGIMGILEIIPANLLLMATIIYTGGTICMPIAVALILGSSVTTLAGIGTAALSSLWVLRWPSLRHAIPLVLHVLLFISPVLFRLDAQVEGPARTMISLIPIAGPIEFLRGYIGGSGGANLMSISLMIAIALFALGLVSYVFNEDKAVENA